MANQFSSGQFAIAACDVCGFRFKLKDLKPLTIKTKITNILACPECWNPDQPQLSLGLYPVSDPQAVRNPRPDTGYFEAGNDGAGGSREIFWGWNPVGGARADDAGLTPNPLAPKAEVGTVTVNIGAPVPYSVNVSLIPNAILAASVNIQPQANLFKNTLINGRALADVTNNGTVNSADAGAYLDWINGNQTYATYINTIMNQYILANPVTYAAYIVYN